MIYCKKNYWLYKDATCHCLWPCDFTDVTAFYSLFLLVLHYCFFLYIFFLLLLFLWLFKFFYQVHFHGSVVLFQGHLSAPSAAFSGCFFGLFFPVLLCVFYFFIFKHSIELSSLPIGSSYGILLGLLLPSFMFVIAVVSVLIDTWQGSFFF